MHTLHDDDKRACSGVVETCLHGLIPPIQHAFPDLRAIAIDHVVRIIDADKIATIPSQSTIDTGGNAVASLVILKPLLLVLIIGQPKLATEMSSCTTGYRSAFGTWCYP
jgi:hypothetical protein